MKYCLNCILPDTRPNLIVEEDGICNACKNSFQKKAEIDWESREAAFQKVVATAKKKSSGYDCLIPVSGGKDSTWQVAMCKKYGMNPLAVTWRTPGRTALGQRNLDNLIRLGVDHIDYTINPDVEKKFMYKALKDYGSTGVPMHMAMFNIPPTIALKFDIPLIVWGENSAFEYGSKDAETTGFTLDKKWFKQFGVTHGTTAADWISKDLNKKELTAYFGPDENELEQKEIKAVFLGYYFEWDTHITLKAALENGFEIRKEGPKMGYYNFTDIDDDFMSIHHFFKWYKFGFTRLFDNLSLEIRNGRMTRKKALDVLREMREQTPTDDIEKLCQFLDITIDHFYEIAEEYRNKEIWKNDNGVWKLENFIIPDWEWK